MMESGALDAVQSGALDEMARWTVRRRSRRDAEKERWEWE